MQNRKVISNHVITSSSSSSWSHQANEGLQQQQQQQQQHDSSSSNHNDNLLLESECVLTDLNNIIDSHDSRSNTTAKQQATKKSKQIINSLKASSSIFMTNDVNINNNTNNNTIKLKSTTHDNSSTNLKANSIMSTSTNGLNSIKKFKSKSFLLSLNRKVLDSPSNSSITFDPISYNSSKAVNTTNQHNIHNTISVPKSKKASLNLMSTSVTSSSNIPSQHQQQQQTVASSLTSAGLLSSSTKKKRSSLFNLFSFSNSSSTSNHTNKTNSTSSTTSLNKQQTNVNKSSLNVNTTNINIDYEDDVFVKKELEQTNNNNTNKIILTKRPLSSSTMEPIINTINYSSATLSNQPAPTYSSSSTSSSSSTTSSTASNRFRPHSIAFPSNYQTIHRMNSSNVTKPAFKESNSATKPVQLVDPELDDDDDLVDEPARKAEAVKLAKKPSIQSRGFSIPLNASFCLNPNPHLKYSNSDLNSSNPRATSIRTTSSLCLYTPVPAADLNNNNSSSINNNNKNHNISKTLDHKLLNQKKSIDLEDDLFNNEDFDDSILFKPDSFDIDTEGSCLKELNHRFKLNNETGNSDSTLHINSIRNGNDQFESDLFKQKIATNENTTTTTTNASCISNNQSQKEQSLLTNNEKNLKLKSSQIKRNMSNRDSSGLFYSNYDNNNNNENLNGSVTSPQMNHRITRKPKDMNEYFNANKQDDDQEDEDEEEETVQSTCINDHHHHHQRQTSHRSDSIQKQQTENEEECKSNGQLATNNYKKKTFQQTKSLVNIDSQFKKSLELTNSSTQASAVSNEEDKLMSASKLTNRPLSVTSSTLKQSPILLAFHSAYFNKTSIEMVQIKKGTKLKDILKPVLDNHNMSIDSYTIYREDNNKTINSIDMEKSSENFSGLRLFLKPNQKSDYESELAKTSEPNLKVNKLRKSSLQMPSIPPALTLNTNENKTNENNLLSCNNSSTTLANSIIIPNSTNNTNNNNNNNSSTSSSSNNWQSYFNSKINNSKEKFNLKQKRNSCIAVMSNDYTNSGSGAGGSSGSSQNSTINTLPDSSGQTNLTGRESICSFQSYLPSPENSPTEKYLSTNSRLLNKHGFRKMANLSSIFVTSLNRSREQSRREQLDKMLESFVSELPKLPDELNVKHYDAQLLEIESEWNKFVGETYAQNLQAKLAKQQMAIWELLTTECSHIKTTKIIIDVFMSCLLSLKQNESTSDLFNDIDVRKLFCNITDVFNCNLNFWMKYLLPIVQTLNSSPLNKLIDPASLIDGFSDFKNLFSPYEEFILEKNNSLEYFKKKSEENENFNRFISWAENHPQVGRLKIADFMMIPVQRLTKYELLLKKIKQFTEDESRREHIGAIIDCVNSLPNSINIKLKYLAQFNDISDSIEKYEGIVGPNDEINELLSAYKTLDIKSPLPGCLPSAIRELIHQGPLRLKESSRSLDVYCFLFTDLLLITKQKQNKKYKIIKPPVSTNRILVKELNQTDRAFVVVSLNDYSVPDSVSMFVSIQAKKWIELIELAKKKYLDELATAKQHHEAVFDFKSEINSKKSQSSSTSSVFAPLTPNSSNNNFDDENQNAKSEKQFRRDSSATLTEQKSLGQENEEDYDDEDSTVANKISTITSFSSSKIVNQQQQPRQYQQNSVRISSRLVDRKMQRRNMTDSLTSQLTSMDEKHSIVMNSIIKRNSLNNESKASNNEVNTFKQQHQQQPVQANEQQYQQNQLINLCGDSTSTIISTDSGVSETTNHVVSDESLSKSPMLMMSMQAANITPIEEHPKPNQQQQLPNKASSLKATNSVLSTTSTISTASSSSSSSSSSTSSSSNEPTNISYSSSFNSTSSSARLAKLNTNKSLLDQQQSGNTNSKGQGFSSTSLKYAKHYDDEDADDDDDLLEQHHHDDNEEEEEEEQEEAEDDDYVDLYEIKTPLKYTRQHSTGDLEQHSAYSNLYNDVLPQSSRRHNSVKHRSNSTNDAQTHLNYYLSNKTNPYISQQHHSHHHNHLHHHHQQQQQHQKYDMNNNDTDLTSRFLDLINSTNMKSKYQQSQAKLSSSSSVSMPKYNQIQHINQHQPLRKTYSKQNSTSFVNESVRVNSSDLIVKNLNENSSSSTEYDSSVMSAQMYQSNYSTPGLDNHHRMILVKLLNTTMDATEV